MSNQNNFTNNQHLSTEDNLDDNDDDSDCHGIDDKLGVCL